MKWYTMIAATLLLLVLVGCGGNMYETSDTQDEDTETIDNNTNDDSNPEGDDTSTTEDENSDRDSESGEPQSSNEEEGETDVDSQENDSESELGIDEDGTTHAIDLEDTTPIEYSVPEDTTTYDSGLVFVKQEDALWRVVDRMGNVYRVSTSYTPISVGTVADEAHVSENEEGDVQVELEHRFTQHENAVVLEGDSDAVAREFVTDLLDQTSSITDYRIRDVDVETRGKGMLIVTLKYDVEPKSTDSEWPSIDESGYTQLMNYRFVVYGYETTWVVPTYPSLIDGSVLDDGNNTAVNGSGSVEQGNNSQQDSSEQGNGSTTGSSQENTARVDLYQSGNNHYYYVREQEEQSQRLQGSDIYEYTSILYSQKDNEQLPLTSGVRNTDYKVLKIQNGHIYLLQEAWEPFSESFPSGIGVIDMEANSYERLYLGAVKEAATTSQNIYLFATDALFAIDVVNSRLVTVADLPETMNFRMHNMTVRGIENNVMEVQVDGDQGTESYAINLGTGDIVDITQ